MKSRLSGIACVAILITILVILPGRASAGPSTTTIEKILSRAESYNGKEVSVAGKIVNLRPKTSKRGNTYTTFTLLGSGGKGSLNVYSRGHAEVKQGQIVKVTGIYRKEKRVGKYTFYDEIDAADIKKE